MTGKRDAHNDHARSKCERCAADIAAAERRGIERAAKWLEDNLGEWAGLAAMRAALLPASQATGGEACKLPLPHDCDRAAHAAPPVVQQPKCDTTTGPCACGAWHEAPAVQRPVEAMQPAGARCFACQGKGKLTRIVARKPVKIECPRCSGTGEEP
jgi:hypothetical protein